MEYTKADLFNDIHQLIEKYVEQEFAKLLPDIAEEEEVQVEQDEEGDYIDRLTGNIWDLDAQEIIGEKNMKTGEKTWYNRKDDLEAVKADLSQLAGELKKQVPEQVPEPEKTTPSTGTKSTKKKKK